MNIITVLLLLATSNMTPSQYNIKKTFEKNLKSIIVSVEIIPASEWKWNKNYPSNFFVNLPPNTQLIEKNVIYLNGHPRFTFNIQGQIKSIKEITVDGSFSLCTKIICKAWRHKKFRIEEKNETKSL